MLLHRRVGMDCWDSANWLSRRPAWSYDDGELHDLAQVALGAFWHTLVQEQSRFANYTVLCDVFATQDFLNLNLAKCSLKCVLCVLFFRRTTRTKNIFMAASGCGNGGSKGISNAGRASSTDSRRTAIIVQPVQPTCCRDSLLSHWSSVELSSVQPLVD